MSHPRDLAKGLGVHLALPGLATLELGEGEMVRLAWVSFMVITEDPLIMEALADTVCIMVCRKRTQFTFVSQGL